MKTGTYSIIFIILAAFSLQNCRSLNNQSQKISKDCQALIVDAEIFQQSVRQPQLSYVIDTAYIDGQTLKLDVAYNGGCEDHDFLFLWDGVRLPSNPPVFRLILKHENSGDSCGQYIQKSLCFSIHEFGEESGKLQIQGWSDALALNQ